MTAHIVNDDKNDKIPAYSTTSCIFLKNGNKKKWNGYCLMQNTLLHTEGLSVSKSQIIAISDLVLCSIIAQCSLGRKYNI